MQAPSGTGWSCGCGGWNLTAAPACHQCGSAPPHILMASPGTGLPLPRASLVGASPGQAGHRLSLDGEHPLVFGRQAGTDVPLEDDPTASGYHCRVYWSDPYWGVEDLGSTNGTFVNGQRVAGSGVLNHGDLLQIGQTQFRFYLAPAVPAGGPDRTVRMAHPALAPAPAYLPAPRVVSRKDRATAGVLAILLGGFGAHLFYLDQPGWGVGYLLTSFVPLVACCLIFPFNMLAPMLVGTMSLVQGIVYLCAGDEEFQQKYVVEGRLL